MSLFKGLSAACILVATATLGGQAKADCEDPTNAFDDVYCYSKLYIEADGDLNKAYGELSKLLSKDEKATLKPGSRVAIVFKLKDGRELLGEFEARKPAP